MRGCSAGRLGGVNQATHRMVIDAAPSAVLLIRPAEGPDRREISSEAKQRGAEGSRPGSQSGRARRPAGRPTDRPTEARGERVARGTQRAVVLAFAYTLVIVRKRATRLQTCNFARVARSWAKPRDAALSLPPPPYHAAADLCGSVWRRRMAPALSATYMVGVALMKYVKMQRRVPVLEVLVRFLHDEITKTEVHTPIEPFPLPPVADASASPTPLSQKFAFSRAPARAQP